MSPRAEWLLVNEIQPRIGSAVKYAVNKVGSEDDGELTQDGLCMAAKMLTNTEINGKEVTAGNIAYYTLQHLKSGRRSYGSSILDPLHPMSQINGISTLASFHDSFKQDDDGGELSLEEVMATNSEDPAYATARRMDWAAFMAGLDTRTLAVIECLLAGEKLSLLAEQLKLSVWTMHECKKRLAQKVVEFMGVDVLVVCQEKPSWANNINATREHQACKFERS
jgi:hypothetical protein